MNLGDPIRDRNKIQDMKINLKQKNSKEYALFVIGINAALRILDLLKLRLCDVLWDDKKIKFIKLIEVKLRRKEIFNLIRLLKKLSGNFKMVRKVFD